MTQHSLSKSFLSGLINSLPFVLVIIPFGLLFGVVATEAGFDLTQAMAMTVLVVAGAAQFAAVQLIVEDAPVFVILATALAVNMRMAMYSASMVPHLGAAPLWQRACVAYFMTDQSYGVSIKRFEEDPPLTLAQKVAFFAGSAAIIAPNWFLAAYIGAVAGAAIPPDYALDFAVPITFIAIVAPQLRSLPHVAAALVSVLVALALAWVPYSMGLLVAAALAMVTGAATELWLERRVR